MVAQAKRLARNPDNKGLEGRRSRKVVECLLLAVEIDLLLHGFERAASPKIRRIDIVIGIGVPSLIGRNEFVELMDDEKNGIELASIGHEGVERVVGFAGTEAQRVVRAIGRSFGVGASPAVLAGGGDGNCEVLYARAGTVVGRIVRAKWRHGAVRIEAINPTPEVIRGIYLDRSVGSGWVQPEAGLAIEIPSH